MSVTIHLPDGVEEQLRSKFTDLDRHILEGFVIEKYRRGELSSHQVAQILGFNSRWETIDFLSRHGVYPNYDVEDFEADVKTLEQILSERK